MLIGMSYEQFWEDDPQLYWLYETAYNYKKEMEFKENNYLAWLQGQYNLMAFRQVMSDSFSKNNRNIYPKVPFGEKEREEELTSKQKLEKFKQIAARFNDDFRRKQIK